MEFLKKYNDIIISILIVLSLVLFGKIISTFIVSYNDIDSSVLRNEYKVYSYLLLIYCVTMFYVLIDIKFQFNIKQKKLTNFKYTVFPLILVLIPTYNNFELYREYTLNINLIFYHFILMCIIGILNELIFRKLIFNLLLNKRSLIFSIVVSSLLYGLAHFINVRQSEFLLVSIFQQFIYAFGIGFLMVTLYYVTNSLFIPITIQTLFNFNFSFDLIYWINEDTGIISRSNSIFHEFLSFSFFIIISSILILYSIFILKRTKSKIR